MNKKNILSCTIFTIIVTTLLTLCFLYEQQDNALNNVEKNIINKTAKYNYQVYLDGEKIGLIDSKDELYSLINQEQIDIKKKYNVDQVYPPKGFQIIKTNTYENTVTTVENVYETIKEEKQFTVKGYMIIIKKNESGVDPTYIYVLDKNVFEQAINNVVTTFIGNERFEQYKNNSQPEILDTGYTIENMYFKDSITIKEAYISVDETIYTDVTELTKYLLFGENNTAKEYTVVQGDTIAKIAYDNKLNTSELLIANEELKSEDTLLAIGQKLNVALINPVLTLIYEELVVEDVERTFTQIVEEDNSRYVDYKEVKQEGENGIDRITSRVQFINGEQNQGGSIIGTPQVIKAAKNQIIIKGTKRYNNSSTYVDTGDTWGWPTNQPSIITSHFGYRWGTIHDGMDISGTGYGSPVYASLDGVVVSSQYGGMVGSSAGKNVVIQHSNGYYSVYAHCSQLYVRVGQQVTRGQKIAAMGNTGFVTGTHLHFGLFYGKPYNGGKAIDPRQLWGL